MFAAGITSTGLHVASDDEIKNTSLKPKGADLFSEIIGAGHYYLSSFE